MPTLLLNTIALDPNRWTADKTPHTDLESALERIAEAGFQRLEVWPPHLLALDAGRFEALARRLADLEMAAPIVGLYPALHLGGEARAREWATAEALVRRAERLGAGAVKMFAGTLGRADADVDALSRSLDFAHRLARLCADAGMTLVAEAHPDTLCDSVEATLDFLDRVPGTRVCYQPFDFASTQRTVADYEALAPHVVHVHLQGRRGGEMSLLEDADINYGALFKALAAGGFEGALSIEFVEGCVVPRPADFDLDLVLENAARDRRFVLAAMPGVA